VTSSGDLLFGTIGSVGLISTSTGDTASYPVTVDITGSPTGLHDGSAATVTLIYAQLTNVLTVPSGAVRTENGRTVVTLVSGDQQTVTPVTTGETDGTNTEIVSGVNEGDEVQITTTARGGGASTQGGQSGTSGGESGGFPGGGTGDMSGGTPPDMSGFSGGQGGLR